jgi:hypothetical protein
MLVDPIGFRELDGGIALEIPDRVRNGQAGRKIPQFQITFGIRSALLLHDHLFDVGLDPTAERLFDVFRRPESKLH